MGELFLEGLRRLNVILASATVLISFSLLTYLFVYNFRNAVARAFVAVLAFVTVVYVGDVFLASARLPANHPAAQFWLGFEWLGIAFTGPTYLHFGDALLQTMGDKSSLRRGAVFVAYGLGALSLWAVLTTDLVTGDVIGSPGSIHFAAGTYFWGFALYYLACTAWGATSVLGARQLALTSRSRRRLGYLLVSVAAPLSTFPYLTAGGETLAASPVAFRLIAAAANIAIATMIVVVAYGVAFHGALTPDRAVKRDLIKYLIQAPTLGVFVIATMQLVPTRLEESLGLPRDVVLVLAMVVGIVAYQFVVRALKPVVDLLIFGSEGGRDVMWLRRLDERLVTARDLEQLLENILTAMCDRLRVSTGCIIVMQGRRLQIDAYAGSRSRALQLLASLEGDTLKSLLDEERFGPVDGFWVHVLRPPGGGAALGLLVLEDPGRELELEEERAFRHLIGRAETAMEDRVVQQRVVAALRDLEPELEGIQRLRGALQEGSGQELGRIDASPIYDPDFPAWVKEALSHYWGGPKLTESPLLGLTVVRESVEHHDYDPAKAMRSVLDEALDSLKPPGERSLTAREWLVYNILELRFVRGLKVRDIARRLAVSESDLYRKQRVAIEALAGQLAALETYSAEDTPEGKAQAADGGRQEEPDAADARRQEEAEADDDRRQEETEADDAP